MKDFLGNDIEVGDEVVYTTNYTDNTLSRGVVVGFTKTMLIIEQRFVCDGVVRIGRKEKKSADKTVVVARSTKPANNPEYTGGKVQQNVKSCFDCKFYVPEDNYCNLRCTYCYSVCPHFDESTDE